MCRMHARWLTLALLVAGFSQPLVPQQRTSTISGTVRDQSGRLVPGARILARHLETGTVREAQTGEAGLYRIAALELGSYEVTAEKPGFRTALARGILLTLEREAVVDLTLEVGPHQERLEVTGESRTIEAAASALSGHIDSKSIEELPLNGRDWVQLATLEAGTVVARAQYRNVNTGYGLPLSLSGSRPYQNNFQLDGVSLTSYAGATPGGINGVNLGVDAIREFTVLTSSYSARYGRAGGGVVHAVTRSGGNRIHGSAFYFHRNDNLDARNFFDGPNKPEFRRHQFGGSLGGPLVRNRTFFFTSYEALRELRGTTTIDTTLSEAARRGELAAGRVPVDPVAAKFAALYPLPNGPLFGDTGLFLYTDDEIGSQDLAVARVDLNLGDRDRLFLRYTLDDGARSDLTAFALGLRRASTRWQSSALEHTRIFSPALLHTARFGFMRSLTDGGSTATLTPATDDPALGFLPGAQVAGIVVVGGLTAFPGGTGAVDRDRHAFNSFQFHNELTWILGRTTLHVGGRLERIRFNTDSQSTASGEFRFRSVADLLRNLPDRFQAQLPGSDTVRGHRQWVPAAYLQASHRLSSRLTLDVGLRHEWATVPVEVNGKIANLDELTSPKMRVGAPLFANPSYKNFVPRAGLAWDVWGNGTTLVRSGYGIFADLLLSQFLLLAGVRNPPFFLRGSVHSLRQGDFPKGGYAALVGAGTPEYRIERLEPHPRQPYVQHWNFNIEQALAAALTLRLAYVGSHGLNLSSLVEDANLAEPVRLDDGRLFFPAGGRKLNPNFSQIRDRRFEAHSFYHALRVQLRRRLSRGLYGQLAYTFSKSIDDSSTFFIVTEADNGISLPLNGHPRFNRGLSGHDVRHQLSVSGTWALPSPAHGAARLVFRGWQMALIAVYSSGVPFSARLGYDAARTLTTRPDFRSGQRPDLAPGASPNPVTGDPNRWIDPSAFRRP